ncbi:flavodoxin family protein [Ruminiclostridium josui]|uniref:flavodoxin family protein n=1 Tax=Ruminiclostridium josui TaxID=1499 RepID=UPI000465D3F0|nr:flavodoxin family protein [Ruminiclostridium josui]
MKKIFAYVGSKQGHHSYTWQLTNIVLEQVSLLGSGSIQYKIYSADEVKIEFCQGCKCCFIEGFCPYDTSDAMESIKNEILQSDLILLASPVYAHNVSGHMKVFLDRITYWMHLFRLLGKLGVTISTSDSNGNEYVNGYLNKFMQYCGVNVISNFKALKADDTGINFGNLDIESLSKHIYCNLISNEPTIATPIQESLFKSLKNHYLLLEENNIKSAEYTYWKEHKYLECESYSELIKKIGNPKL